MEESVEGHLLIVSDQGFVELDGTRMVEHPGLSHQLDIRQDPFFIQVFQDRRGSVWFSTSAGLARRINGSIERFQPYGVGSHHDVRGVYEDPQGNLWVLRATGIFRVSGTQLEPLAMMRACLDGNASDSDTVRFDATSGSGTLSTLACIGKRHFRSAQIGPSPHHFTRKSSPILWPQPFYLGVVVERPSLHNLDR